MTCVLKYLKTPPCRAQEEMAAAVPTWEASIRLLNLSGPHLSNSNDGELRGLTY